MRLKSLKNTEFVSGIAIFSILTVFFFGFSKPRFVVIDMKRTIETPSTLLSHSKLSKEEQERLMTRFSTYLPAVIKDYGKKHHLLIMSASILVSQKELDITDLIIDKTIERLKNEI